MAWRGIVGKAFTVPEFEKYVGSLTFGVWRPRFIVVHNTSVPDRKTWDGWQARKPPLTDEMWGQNLERYYKGLGWSGCPHLVVTPRSILVLNPLTTAGTHSPAWNSISWGVETVGEFDRDPFTGSIKDNLVAALAILHAAAGLQLVPYERGVRGLHFHKEDPKTTHKSCPGRNMVKSDLIKGVQAEIERRNGGSIPQTKAETSVSSKPPQGICLICGRHRARKHASLPR
jgi:N-acetylmuramoyl-L-alanine amidase